MLDFSVASLQDIIIHKVGNKQQDEDLILSSSTLHLKDEVIGDLLSQYFLKPFKQEIFFHFEHPAGLGAHPLYELVKSTFASQGNFIDASKQMASLLYEESNHPNIKGGELYVTYLKDCRIGEEYHDAIGIFKSESKETFLKVYQGGDNNLDLEYDNGVNINKLDKGCIIFNTDEDEGYRICVVDHTNKSSDIAQFWKNDFLQVVPREDNFFYTENYMNMCKGFCDDVFNPNNDVERTDQISMLKRSVDYFANNDQFDKNQFESQVIEDPGVIEAFNNYQQDFVEKNDLPMQFDFPISNDAVKNNKKFFKSVLKLDKKFHVYVHGGHNYIERGFDDSRKMNFYKLYFDEES